MAFLFAILGGLGRRWLVLRPAAGFHVRTADCAAFPVKNCARRMDANMRRTLRELRPGK